MVKTVLQAALAGVAACVLYTAWMIVQGMLLTLNYVPDIQASYESVEHLESKVSFGAIVQPGWFISWPYVMVFAAGALLFLAGKKLLVRSKRRSPRP